MLEAEWATDGHDEFADLEARRATEGGDWQRTIRGDLQQGEIAAGVLAKYFGLHHFAIMQMHFDRLAVFDDVIIGHHQTISTDNETTTGAKWCRAIWQGRMVFGEGTVTVHGVHMEAHHRWQQALGESDQRRIEALQQRVRLSGSRRFSPQLGSRRSDSIEQERTEQRTYED